MVNERFLKRVETERLLNASSRNCSDHLCVIPVQNPSREDSWESMKRRFTHARLKSLQHFMYFVNFLKIVHVYTVPDEKIYSM